MPEPRIKLAKELVTLATSMIDISDGLIGDITHICENSSVGATIYFEKIPVSKQIGNLLETKTDYSHLIWSGGDDYELLFTAPQENETVISDLSRKLDIRLTKIGEITETQKVILLAGDGSEINTQQTGYRHF